MTSPPAFRRLVPDWPFQPPIVRWGLREAFLCLIGAQVVAAFWAIGAATVSDELGFGSRSIGLLVISNLGLWFGYFAGPGAFSRSLGQGPRLDFNIGIVGWEAVLAALVGIAMQLAVLPVFYWPINRLVDADPGASARELVDRVDGPLDVVLLALAVVLIAPVVEERFFRGMLLPALTNSLGPAIGIIGSSAVFALVHQEAITFPGLFLFACVLAWLTATTGRIGPAIVAHMAFNATSVVQLLINASGP